MHSGNSSISLALLALILILVVEKQSRKRRASLFQMRSITTKGFQIPSSSRPKEQIEIASESLEYHHEVAMLTSGNSLPSSVSKIGPKNGLEMKMFEINTERFPMVRSSHDPPYVPIHRRFSSRNSIDPRSPLADCQERSIQANDFAGRKSYRRCRSQSTLALKQDNPKNEAMKESNLVNRIEDDLKKTSKERIMESKRQTAFDADIPEIPLSPCLNGRFKWWSPMKNLQANNKTPIGIVLTDKRNRRYSTIFDLSTEIFSNRFGSGKNNHGSVTQVDHSGLLDKETDTSPLDSLSWSHTGSCSQFPSHQFSELIHSLGHQMQLLS